ncbi:MAG: serine/threonine protein kinase [Verrucomicrobia bacterium]|nr:serine/threonine protein kinase [Verrucomicrobiota bacterium]
MPAEPGSNDDALAAALDSYLAELQAGRKPDRASFLARHPELVTMLDCVEALHHLAPPPSSAHAETIDSSADGQTPRQPKPEPFADFGRYDLLEEIGRGGMGVVYRARQKELDRVVALKIILAGQLASPEIVRRFLAESRAAARLQHPNIVRVFEAGEFQGRHFFAMEHVAGSNLAALARRGPLDPVDAARLVCTVARAVEHLHSQGIVHRDLKPSNILLDEKGRPFVTDFGLAKLLDAQSQMTQSGVIAGTPSYMPPEQAAGRVAEIGPRSDVYSLGAILYELLAGRPPFQAESPLDTLVQVIESEPTLLRDVNPRAPRELELICQRCLEKSPDARYASAAALADDLERFLKGDAIEAQPHGVWQQARRWARREPALASRLIALALCAVVAQAKYSAVHNVPLSLHVNVMTVLAVWMLVSIVCQWFLRNERRAGVTRFVWAGADILLLTAVLKVDDAFLSPLIVGYPMLVVASGLWFRVSLVAFTTVVAALVYSVLVFDNYCRGAGQGQWNWHAIFVVALAIIGFIVAYQVRRVRALSRFYEGRHLP